MKLQKIDNRESYSELIGRFSSKETISNNYMLPAEVTGLIAEGRLKEWHDDDNCFFFVEKDGGINRLYYLINNLSNKPTIDCRSALVSEILFRGNSGKPTVEIEFLKACGLKLNLRRDQYAAPITLSIDCEPTFVRTTEDARKVINLFNSTFDKYSGDYINPEHADSLFESKSLLCDYSQYGEIQGALQISSTGRNAWVSHLVVEREFRGQGVGDKLMSMFVTHAKQQEYKRLMLWVQHQNKAALSLYNKYGFKYTDKSTISLIKE